MHRTDQLSYLFGTWPAAATGCLGLFLLEYLIRLLVEYLSRNKFKQFVFVVDQVSSR